MASSWWAAGAVTAALLAGQALSTSPLRDAATGEPVTDLRMEIPIGHLATAPFSAWADLASFNSVRQHRALAGWLLAGYWIWWGAGWALERGRGRSRGGSPSGASPAGASRRPPWPRVTGALLGYAAYLFGAAAFIAWAALSPRAMARLALEDAQLLAVDFHSHTNASWDARRSFTPERNARWHLDAGYGAAYITDHNTSAAALEAALLSQRAWRPGDFRVLAGFEARLPGSHIVTLGGPSPAAAGKPDDAVSFLRRQRAGGRPAFMSLPEYGRHPPESWERFADSGAAGFEIANGAPQALDFPASLRRRVVDLCRRRGLAVLGVSDSHGWGRAPFAWSVMRLPGHRDFGPERLATEIEGALRAGGYRAVRVIERTKQEPLPFPWIILDPWLSLLTLVRTLSWPQAAACAAWAWFAAALLALRRRA